MKKLALMAALAAGIAAAPAQAAVLWHIDFDGTNISAPGMFGVFGSYTPETATAGPWNAAGWAGEYASARNSGSFAFSLSNLPTHDTISAAFVLGFLESWDSRDGTVTPDNLEILIDGVVVASMTANNASGSINDFDGGTVLAQYVQANGNNFFSDTLVDMSTAPFLTFAHSASTLLIEFRATGGGWQGGTDESFGIDNFRLDYFLRGAVPEPATWAMLILGFGAVGGAMRRRQTARVRYA